MNDDQNVLLLETDETGLYEWYTDFYYQHPFSHGELRLLIDSILFSRQIPQQQRKELIRKIESLSSKYFNSRLGHYYLICNNDKYENLSHYRLDRITEIELLLSKQKPIDKIEGQQKR